MPTNRSTTETPKSDPAAELAAAVAAIEGIGGIESRPTNDQAAACCQLWNGEGRRVGIVLYRKRNRVYRWCALPEDGVTKEYRTAAEAVNAVVRYTDEIVVTVRLKLAKPVALETKRVALIAVAQDFAAAAAEVVSTRANPLFDDVVSGSVSLLGNRVHANIPAPESGSPP